MRAGGEGDDRGWDGCMASPTRWTWVWVNSGSWWWTGRPGVLRLLGSHRVGHDWATELNWTWHILWSIFILCVFVIWISSLVRSLGFLPILKLGCSFSHCWVLRVLYIFWISLSSDGKESACIAGDLGLIPGLGRSPGEGNGYPLLYSCLEISMDRGAWQATYVQWGPWVRHDWATNTFIKCLFR